MSVAIAVRDPGGKVYVGGDSAVISSSTGDVGIATLATASNPKVFRIGQYVIGGCGSPRILNVIQGMEWPEPEGELDRPFVTREIITPIQETLGNHNVAMMAHEGGEAIFKVQLIIAHGNKIYEVTPELAVIEYQDDFLAIGAAAELARGVLWTMDKTAKPKGAKDRLVMALTATSELTVVSRPPYVIMDTEA